MEPKTKYYKRARPGPVGYHRWRGETKWALGRTTCAILHLWYVNKAVQANDNNLLTLVTSFPGVLSRGNPQCTLNPAQRHPQNALYSDLPSWHTCATIGLGLTVRYWVLFDFALLPLLPTHFVSVSYMPRFTCLIHLLVIIEES